MVAPYEGGLSDRKYGPMTKGTRYKDDNILCGNDEEDVDFSRDEEGDEDIGIGHEDDGAAVLFDDEDLFGD